MAKALIVNPNERQRAIAIPPKEVGDQLRYGMTRIYKMIRDGELESFIDGGSRRVLTSSVDAYVERRLAASKGSPRASKRRGGPGRPRKVTT